MSPVIFSHATFLIWLTDFLPIFGGVRSRRGELLLEHIELETTIYHTPLIHNFSGEELNVTELQETYT
jgi:hypothetical protein